MDLFDCIIVGGGPAGLNAAMVLARCRRKILVFDSGTHRNRQSQGMHNYLTRDGILPAVFLGICRQELKKYGVKILPKTITGGKKTKDKFFELEDEQGGRYRSKMLLLATGLSDNIPGVPGFAEMFGHSVFHCPYCDGWEVKDQKLGVYARDKNGSELALALKQWSPDVTLYTDGKFKLKPEEVEQLKGNEIEIVKTKIARLEGREKKLRKIVFATGEERRCDALFIVNGYKQQCQLAGALGCEINKKGVVVTNRFQQTSVAGLYVAGDAAKDMQFVVVAAAEGAKAAVIINKQLQKETTVRKLLLKKTT